MQKKYRNELHTKTMEKNETLNNKLTFKVDEDPVKFLTTISVVDSGLFFEIIENKIDYHLFNYKYSCYKPHRPIIVNKNKDFFKAKIECITGPNPTLSFDVIRKQFTQWLNKEVEEYYHEIITDDNWKVYLEYTEYIHESLHDSNDFSKFSNKEKNQIANQLDEIKEEIFTNDDFREENLSVIDKMISYIKDALNRLLKVEWKIVFYNIMKDLLEDVLMSGLAKKALLTIFTGALSFIGTLM